MLALPLGENASTDILPSSSIVRLVAREGKKPPAISECKLGILVEPVNVRLLPDLQDGYKWSVLPEREHLFTKQLSKYSIGAYMELCREVGKSFEAVPPSQPPGDLTGQSLEVGTAPQFLS
jgi:hypothetical protein